MSKTKSTRYPYAERLLPVIPLDAKHADKLDRLCNATGDTATATVRRLILAAKLPKGETK